MTKAEEKETPKKARKTRLRYAGFSDERAILKGDTFGGRLPDGLDQDLVFNEANNHMVEVELDPEVLDLLLSTQVERDGSGDFFPAFEDVTGKKVVAPNGWARRWRPTGHTDARDVHGAIEAMTGELPAGAFGEPSTGGSGTGSTAS